MIYQRTYSKLLVVALCASASFIGGADLVPIADQDLSEIGGQAILNVSTGSTSGGYDYVRLGAGLDILANANVDRLSLGIGGANGGGGTDIDFRNVSVGTISGSTVRGLRMVDPYIEFVWDENGATREVVGMRVGARRMEGNLSSLITSLSGSLRLQGVVDVGIANLTLNSVGSGTRITQVTATLAAPWPLNQVPLTQDLDEVKQLTFNGAENFFLSIQNRTVNYDPISAGVSQSAARAGFWINLEEGSNVVADNLNLAFGGGFIQGSSPYLNNCFGGNQGGSCLSGR